MLHKARPVYIVNAIRSPVAKARGAFAHTRPDDLLATVIQALLKKHPGLPRIAIEDVIVGCAMPEATQGMNIARNAVLLADLPDSIPGMTINRFCASGLQSIALAANAIRAGEASLLLAGGVESMSMVPMGGFHYSPNPITFEKKKHLAMAYTMGITAEKVAEKWHIGRAQQDKFALISHERAALARNQALFTNEICPIKTISRIPDLQTGLTEHLYAEITQDDGIRDDCSLEKLAQLAPVFDREGTVTAGNTSQMSDGAAMLLLADEESLEKYNLIPMARFINFVVTGVAPEYMGIGPATAIPLCLQKSGVTLNEIDWIELNEAFAAQSLAVIRELQLDPALVNPQGGAIALGHPLGATGAIRTTTLLHGLKRQRKRYGITTMCIGMGMGAAGLFEVLQ